MRIRTWAAGLAAALLSGVGPAQAQSAAPPSPETLKMLERLGDALSLAERNYVVPVSPEKLSETALEQMLSSLDPHSEYISPQELASLRGQDPRNNGSLGLMLTRTAAGIVILRPLEDAPAFREGVQAGDLLMAIDGHPVDQLQLEDAVTRLKGPIGSESTLSLKRGERLLTLNIRRDVVRGRTVRASMRGDIAFIQISSFNESTASDLAVELGKLKAAAPQMTGLVLDLRNNSGGLFDACVSVASEFLDGGVVVSQRGRRPGDVNVYKAKPDGDMIRGLPMVVLVNRGTAAGAEVVAGALEDRRRARLVGLPTFGDGSVQTVMPLKAGGAIKLTTSLLYTPSGASFQKIGLKPDLVVALSRRDAERPALNEAGLNDALDAGEAKAAGDTPAPELPPEGFDVDHGDYQLSRALELLKGAGARPAGVHSAPG